MQKAIFNIKLAFPKVIHVCTKVHNVLLQESNVPVQECNVLAKLRNAQLQQKNPLANPSETCYSIIEQRIFNLMKGETIYYHKPPTAGRSDSIATPTRPVTRQPSTIRSH